MKRVIACFLIASLIVPSVNGDCTNLRVRATNYNTTHVATNYGYKYEQQYHQQTVVAIPVATFIPIPLYVASYVQPPVTAAVATAPAAMPDNSARMLKLLESMDARLQALEKPKVAPVVQPPVMPLVPPEEVDPRLGARVDPKGLSILKRSCLACHESKVATDLGGGFSLFDGFQIAKLTDKQKLKIFKHVEENTMPKLDAKFPAIVKLTDPEASEVKDFILKLK